MKAVVLYKHGGPEVLKYEDIPAPEVGSNEVLVRVKAVGMNHLDLWVRGGLPHLRISYPHLLGSDIAGVVEEVGREAPGIERGQKVILQPAVSCGRCQMCLSGNDNLCRQYAILGENTSGGYAEYVKTQPVNILPYPEGLSFEEAACIPLTFQTAWQMVVRKARVGPGEFVLLNGAGSGVTVAAVQIAKLFGATTIVTSRSDGKLEKIKFFGADYLINSEKQKVSSEVRKITGKAGVDVIIDHVGSSLWEENMKSLAWGGRMIICGATSGFDVRVDLRQIFFKQLQVIGSTMGSKADLFDVLKHVMAGKLKPAVDSTFPLENAADAHRKLASGAQFGKIVLVP